MRFLFLFVGISLYGQTLTPYTCAVLDGTGGSGISVGTTARVTCQTPHQISMRATKGLKFLSTTAPAANSTVTADGQVYRFVSSLAGCSANDVLIGTDNVVTGANLVAAINASSGAGTAYCTSTTANATIMAQEAPDVQASGTPSQSPTIELYYLTPGTAGNGITWSTSTSPASNLGDANTSAHSGTLLEQWYVTLAGCTGTWTPACLDATSKPLYWIAKYHDASSFDLWTSAGNASLNSSTFGSFTGQSITLSYSGLGGSGFTYSNHAEDWALQSSVTDSGSFNQVFPACSDSTHDWECAMAWHIPEVSKYPTDLTCGISCSTGSAVPISSVSVTSGIATVTLTSSWINQNNLIDPSTTGKTLWLRGITDAPGVWIHTSSLVVGTGKTVTANQVVQYCGPGVSTVCPMTGQSYGGAIGIAETTVTGNGTATVNVDDGGLVTCQFASATVLNHKAILDMPTGDYVASSQCRDSGTATFYNGSGYGLGDVIGTIQQAVTAGSTATVWWNAMNSPHSNYTLCGTWPTCKTFTFPTFYPDQTFALSSAYLASTTPLKGYIFGATGATNSTNPLATIPYMLTQYGSYSPATSTQYDWYMNFNKSINCGLVSGLSDQLGNYMTVSQGAALTTGGHGYHNSCWASYAGQKTHMVYTRAITNQEGTGGNAVFPLDANWNGFIITGTWRGKLHYYDGLRAFYFDYFGALRPNTAQDTRGLTANFYPINLTAPPVNTPDEYVTSMQLTYGTPNRWQVTDTSVPTGTAGYHLFWNGPRSSIGTQWEVTYGTGGSAYTLGYSSGTCAVSGNAAGSCTSSDLVTSSWAAGGTASAILPNTPSSNALLADIWFRLRPIATVFGAGVSGSTVYLSTRNDLNMVTGDTINVAGISGITGVGVNANGITTTAVYPRQSWFLNDPTQIWASGLAATSITSAGGTIQIHANNCCFDLLHNGYGITTGDSVLFAGVDAATFNSGLENGGSPWVVTVIDNNNFLLNGSTFAGPYTNKFGFRKVVPSGSLTSITQSGGTCTVNLTVNHNLVPGVMIGVYGTWDSGVVQTGGQNLWIAGDLGTFTVSSIPTAQSFTFACPGVTRATMNQDYNPGAYMGVQSYPFMTYTATSPSGTWTSGTGTITPADNLKNFSEIRFTPGTPPCQILTSSLPGGIVGVAYNQTVSTTGCVAPVTWSVSPAISCTGLTLGAGTGTTNTISGTPSGAGTCSFTVTAIDSQPTTSNQPLSIVISSGGTTGNLVVAPAALTFACTVGGANPANQTFAISATGVTLDNWSATKTQSWVLLSPTSGTAAGNLTVSVSCSGLSVGTYVDTVTTSSTTSGILNSPVTTGITLNVTGTVNVTTTNPMPNGIWTIPYSQTLAASGGTGPYTFAVSTGTLPAGLSLNSSTGVISGSPAIPVGTTAFWVTATDSLSVTSPQQLLSITVPSPGTAFQLGGYGIRH